MVALTLAKILKTPSDHPCGKIIERWEKLLYEAGVYERFLDAHFAAILLSNLKE